MSTDNVVFICPYCGWRNEASIPDNFHRHYSTNKPKESNVIEDIIETIEDCRNPDCRKPITVYWYTAKPAFKLG